MGPIIHLTFKDFNTSLSKLPQSWTKISLGPGFCNSVDLAKSNVTHLTLSTYNDNPIFLPPTLRYLDAGRLRHLPAVPNLTHLKFGRKFNQSIDKLPRTLTHLTLGCEFNQPITKLPPMLRYLSIAEGYTNDYSTTYQFNQSITGLPASLLDLRLHINERFPHSITPPLGLSYLELGIHAKMKQNYAAIRLRVCGMHLLSLRLNGIVLVDSIPDSLVSLHLSGGVCFSEPILLPPSLKVIEVEGRHTGLEIKHLPALEELKMDWNYNETQQTLPVSLKILSLQSYNGMFKFPPMLSHLTLTNDFTASLASMPKSITHLCLAGYNSPIKLLPPMLRELVIGGHYRYHLPLPSSLMRLEVEVYSDTLPITLPEAVVSFTLQVKDPLAIAFDRAGRISFSAARLFKV